MFRLCVLYCEQIAAPSCSTGTRRKVCSVGRVVRRRVLARATVHKMRPLLLWCGSAGRAATVGMRSRGDTSRRSPQSIRGIAGLRSLSPANYAGAFRRTRSGRTFQATIQDIRSRFGTLPDGAPRAAESSKRHTSALQGPNQFRRQ